MSARAVSCGPDLQSAARETRFGEIENQAQRQRLDDAARQLKPVGWRWFSTVLGRTKQLDSCLTAFDFLYNDLDSSWSDLILFSILDMASKSCVAMGWVAKITLFLALSISLCAVFHFPIVVTVKCLAPSENGRS